MKSFLRFLSRISNRLLAFNLLLVFLPAIAFLSLETYEQQLLYQQERSMVQQGRLLAAALGGHEDLDEDEAQRILQNLQQRLDARLRILDQDNRVLADSSRLGPRSDQAKPELEPEDPEPRDNAIYRLGSFLYRLFGRLFLPPEPPGGDSELDANAESARNQAVQKALAGQYGQSFRVSSGTRSLTLYSAIPIRNQEKEVIGAALVSKSTFNILSALYELRLSTFKVVLASVAVAIVLSLLVATTIARPIGLLQRQAQAILDRRGRLKGRFKGSERLDEIGDLSRALEELTRRLEGHIQFIESFASDVSHEFKNPLAAIRNATELLAEVDAPAERERFIGMVLKDIARLEHLLSGVREITHIDAHLEAQEVESVDLRRLLGGLVERYELTGSPAPVHYQLQVPEHPVPVTANAERLAQIFENLLDNARSFSPPGKTVTLEVSTQEGNSQVTIRDQGPGIPEEHLDRIFHRFFSYREQADRQDHAGLGLAIVKAIVDGYGGRVEVANMEEGGAQFLVQLPLSERV